VETIKKRDNDTKATKVRISHSRSYLNAECLSALAFLIETLEKSGAVSSGGDDHNGGFLIHFSRKESFQSSLSMIEVTVLEKDAEATITVTNPYC